MSSLVGCLLISPDHFFNQVVFLLLGFSGSLRIWGSTHSPDVSFASVFSQSVAALLALLTVSFPEQKFLIVINLAYQFFLSWVPHSVLLGRSHCQTLGRLGFFLCHLLGGLQLGFGFGFGFFLLLEEGGNSVGWLVGWLVHLFVEDELGTEARTSCVLRVRSAALPSSVLHCALKPVLPESVLLDTQWSSTVC